MYSANREFIKSAFAKDLKKRFSFHNIPSFPISIKTPPSTKTSRTFLPKATKSDKSAPKETNETIENKKEKEIAAPIILVDLKECEMDKYFINKETKNSNKFLFFKSVHSKRNTNHVFYYSNAFSDYYKEDLKKFSKKFKLVKSRIQIRGDKLRKAIEISKLNDRVLKPPVLKQIFEVTDKDVNHVNCSNDATSLVLKILNQINPIMEAELIQQIKPKKYYYRSNKPLGNHEEENIDYTVNRRYDHMKEIRALMSQAKEKENDAGLSLSTYNSNDKDIQLFDRVEKRPIVHMSNSTNCNNNTNSVNKQTRELVFQTSLFNNLTNKPFNDNKSQSIFTTNTNTHTHTLLDKPFKRTHSAIIKPHSFKGNVKAYQRKSDNYKRSIK